VALITKDSRCAICDGSLRDGSYLATSGVAFPAGDPLWRFCDAPLHWDCYEHWPHRLRFAHQYVTDAIEYEPQNQFWGRALVTDLVYLAVRRKEPGEANVRLFETGTQVRVPLSNWAAWLWDLGLTGRDLHSIEIASLVKALPELRRRFPNPEAVLAVVDWEVKQRLVEAKEEAWAERMRAHRDAIQAHNDACREFVEASGQGGLTCPHCRRKGADIEFVDHAGADRKSFFVCKACSRSFGHDL